MVLLFSILSLGYLSIDDLELDLKISVMTEKEKESFEIIQPIIHNKNFLIPSLLLVNFILIESLPLVLSKSYILFILLINV